jgi:ubiquinone/menaquinone biosynthesis C-methylase UbiE
MEFDDDQHFAEWNEEMARKYDPEDYHLHSNFLVRWVEHRRVKVILRFLGAEYHESILEVGCGAGNVLEQVEQGQLYGIDLSRYLLEKSKHRLAQCSARLTQANAEHLPFADESFDKLICTEVLEHVRHPRKVLSEIARVVTSEAIIVISIPNEKLIDQFKQIINNLGLGSRLLRGDESSYSSPNHMTDEWHLHSFSLNLLNRISGGILVIQEVKAIPSRLIPLRYVIYCQS